MQVRKIRPEEYKRARQFCALAFEYALKEAQESPEAMVARVTSAPKTRQEENWQSQWAAFEDDDQTMLSTFTVIPYQVQFDGHVADMAGIGGVATLPQYRKRGGVRACFEHALPDMYQSGAVFSYLYPFSTAFYRKFGYELACVRNRYKCRLHYMPKRPVEGSCHLLEPGQDLLPDIQSVYAAWQARYNLMTIDSGVDYRWVLEADPFRDREYTYVYRDASGQAKGFMTYAPVVDAGDRTLSCSRFSFVDAEGFDGLIGLLQTLAADHTHILFMLPTDIELGALLPEWSFDAVACTRQTNGMVRVVHVEKALEMARMRGEGSLVLEISDAQIAQNNGRFRVRFAPHKPNEVSRTDDAPDVTLTIQAFSRLICGRYDLSALPWLTDVRLDCPVEKAAQVFYQKPMFISRYF